MRRLLVPTTLAALLLSLPGATTASAAVPDQAGRVLAVRRTATVIRDARTIDAAPEMPLLLNDEVETGGQSRAKLFFRDDSVLNLGEKCRVRVQEYLLSPEKNRSKSIYQLIDGTLKVV
ncbi:MAG: FecR family protein, partial [Candidatus Methylomirabilia bacterium]